ncbi:ZN574 protein, partial [Pandion haliaetus]|nr:ZN574 protein [Pandion haliaetus]
CSHLSASLEDALLHQQHHLGPQQQHHYELVGLAGDYQALAMPESSQYQCLECGQLLCVECKALFASQEVWLAHRQSHRADPPAQQTVGQGQNQALVDLEHSYRKPEEEEEEEGGAEGGGGGTVQLLLYECGECLQLFQTPKDFLEHQAAHLAA